MKSESGQKYVLPWARYNGILLMIAPFCSKNAAMSAVTASWPGIVKYFAVAAVGQ